MINNLNHITVYVITIDRLHGFETFLRILSGCSHTFLIELHTKYSFRISIFTPTVFDHNNDTSHYILFLHIINIVFNYQNQNNSIRQYHAPLIHFQLLYYIWLSIFHTQIVQPVKYYDCRYHKFWWLWSITFIYLFESVIF